MRIADSVAARFGDRPLPADLRALLALSPADDNPLGRVSVLEPGHDPLSLYLAGRDQADPAVMACVAAMNQVNSHAMFVASTGFTSTGYRSWCYWGYWLHPDDPAEPPAVIRFGNWGRYAAQYAIARGSITEALITELTYGEQQFAELAQAAADAGVPITARSPSELARPAVVTHPDALHDRLLRAERAKRGLPSSLADMLAARLGHRPFPADLRALLAMSPAGGRLLGHVRAELIAPGRIHALLDHSYLSDAGSADPDTMANVAAIDAVNSHAVFVASSPSFIWGYWLHPGEPAGPPAVIWWDDEGQCGIARGSLTEALINDQAVSDQEFAELAQMFADAGVPVTVRSRDEYAYELTAPEVVTRPDDLHGRLYREERAKRGLLSS